MDPEQDRLRRIVRIEAYFDDPEPKLGTGFRIGPGKVLTAQHVVERGHDQGAIERAREIRVALDPDGSGEVLNRPAKLLWQGEAKLEPSNYKALDVALLEDELPEDDLQPFRDWIRVPLGESGRWKTSGFVSASPDKDRESLSGTCQPALEMATYLKLVVERLAPRDPETGKVLTWAGISGAPVFVAQGRYEGYLYGVVRSSPESFSDALYAVGTPALLRHVELRRILDVDEPIPPHESLVEQLRGLLEEDPGLAEHVACLDQTMKVRWSEGGSDDLVDGLCTDGNLKPALEHLRDLYTKADPKSAPAERLRRLAVVLVSILANQELPAGQDLTAETIDRLGTASPNFAEAVLAAAHGQPCRFEKMGGPNLPRAYLRVPTTTMEAGIRTMNQVEEQMEELAITLVEKDLDHPRWILKDQKALFCTLAPGKQREMLRKVLRRNLTRLKQRHRRPVYLVAGGELQKKMGPRLDTFLKCLARVLPNLHIVVLETGPERVEQAIDQEDALWPLWEILDLLPEE